MKPAPSPLPSIRVRLMRKLVLVSVVWGLAVAAAMWDAVRHEVDEFMDATLQESAEVLYGLLDLHAGQLPLGERPAGAMVAPPHNEHLIWQLVDARQTVRLRSHRAPDQPLLPVPTPGFSDVGRDWRVYGMPFATRSEPEGTWLYVGQEWTERSDASLEAARYAGGAAVVIGLLCTWWLRVLIRRELQPLADLSEAVRGFDPLHRQALLPPATRAELAPMRHAITDLTQRLAKRVANERAFTAHAAHALRTPLAGMDAQLAVALRECAPELLPRLERSRQAANRLRRVVNALLTLFRSGAEPAWQAVQLDELLIHLPFEGLDVQVSPNTAAVTADPDLLAAALLNLLDNAQRHGASRVVVTLCRQDGETEIEVCDNGSGMAPAERHRLQTAIDAQDYAALSGLGLMLADLVARAHGGGLRLMDTDQGCGVGIRLGTPP